MRRPSLLFSVVVLVLVPAWILADAATGDFNGDGRLDYLFIPQCSPAPCTNSTISVNLGRGDGRFSAQVDTTIASSASNPVVGDFNGDHKSDIAFVNAHSDGTYFLAVMLANGDGSFRPFRLYPLSHPAGLLAGDVNGDGKLDLIVGNETQGVFLGHKDGTFGRVPDAPGVSGWVLADVNHDGKLDVIGPVIWLSNGDGTFQEGQHTDFSIGSPAIADFNADGNLDIAFGVQSGVQLYLGIGDGTFVLTPRKWLFLGEPGDLLSGDFNGDGLPDLLMTRAGQMDIMLNTGDARFRSAVGYLRVSDVLGDFDGDGRSDVLILRSGALPRAALATSNGAFPLPRSYWLPGDAASILPGDLNGDGVLDLVAVSATGDGTWRVNRLMGNGEGTFMLQPKTLVVTHEAYGTLLGVADLNHDGKVDIVTTGGGYLNVLLGLGNGLFQMLVRYPDRAAAQVAIADFNGDGILDLALNSVIFRGVGFFGTVLLGNGDGTFRGGIVLPQAYDQLVAGDFNNDGRADLAAVFGDKVGIMLGNGDGTFQPISALPTPHFASFNRFLMTADFNSDGILDLVEVAPNASGAAIASVFLGTGSGTLRRATNTWIKGKALPGGAVTADFNADGKADLAVSLASGEIAILFGNGAGGFASRAFSLRDWAGSFLGRGEIAAGDFDGNGTQDLAVLTSRSTVAVFLRPE